MMSSSDSQNLAAAATALSEAQVSKKATKKEAAKLEKLRWRQEITTASTATTNLSVDKEDPLGENYDDVPLVEL